MNCYGNPPHDVLVVVQCLSGHCLASYSPLTPARLDHLAREVKKKKKESLGFLRLSPGNEPMNFKEHEPAI